MNYMKDFLFLCNAIIVNVSLFLLINSFFFAHAHSSGHKHSHDDVRWPFEGLFGEYDVISVQRGLQVFREVCSSCHSLKYVRFGSLGERGGPYYYPNKYDSVLSNELVLSLAKSYMIHDIGEDGEDILRPGTLSDSFPSPYKNEKQGMFVNNGVYPPDLSLVSLSLSRHGYRYIYSLLTGYQEPPDDFVLNTGQHYNINAHGNITAMPQPLYDGVVSYMDGTDASLEQMAYDVTHFLAWAADPHMVKRKRIGLIVVTYLIFLSITLYVSFIRIKNSLKETR